MHAKFAVLATAFALALARPQASTTAPSAGSTDGISPCILGCATKATQCKLTDVSCVCTNTDYQNSVAQCIQSTCADQAQAAQQVQAAQCAAGKLFYDTLHLIVD
ncbi:hypothetical protein DL96DRAFT_180217 [Flagelloscypha sp. PMI_526]|nr:hypothetical protein DL96DRAFT_180217 [Flagelloscypha sp. PMI_526]